MTDLPGSPPAARLGSPRWLDGRLVLGVLLVLVSVLVGAKVLASADRSQQVWTATRDLAPGTVLTAGDLELGRVRLFGGADYVLGSEAEPVGQVLRRGVGSHELLPSRSLSPAGLVAFREISVPVPPGHLPADLAHGEQVDVYVTPADKGAQRAPAVRGSDPLAPRQVLSGVLVASITVVRRCVDLADLLATAATGQARAVLLSADLRRLDREALTRLGVGSVAVVGLVPPHDEEAERRLRQLGVKHVLPSDASPADISAAVVEAVVALSPAPADLASLADPRAALADLSPATDPPGLPELDPGAGRVVAVWGPTGAPGRTTVAVGLASELAQLGRPTLLIDADVYGGVVAQVLGLLDEAPGLAAACRQANHGSLDLAGLAGLARQVSPTLRVLSGIARSDRWPELRPASLEQVLSLAASLAAVIVVDLGFCLEQDEELAYDTMAPRRNGATLSVLEGADTVLAVGSADPVGLQRLVRGLGELKEAVPGAQPRVVVNRLRASAVPGDAAREIRGALSRYAGVTDVHLVPLDTGGVDGALAAGRTLLEAAPSSPTRLALAELAATLVGSPVVARKRRLRRR